MKYYAHFSFTRRSDDLKCYILNKQEGCVEKLEFAKFADNKKNKDAGIAGKNYMLFTLPRSPSMRKYFAYVFEYAYGKPITSVEGLNGQFRTFGDGKQLGSKDLILFQFSDDMMSLDMYFCKDLAPSISKKKAYFQNWCNGEEVNYSLPEGRGL